mgnify:CR=1 FL=1
MKKILLLFCPLLLAACHGGVPGYYRTPIVQGNIIAPKKVSRLKIGMTKKQVQYLLGKPMVDPGFESNRENYVFYYRNPRAHVHKSKLILYFNHNKLTKVAGSHEFTSKIKGRSNGSSGPKS